MDDIKEVFGRINVAMVRFSHTLESKLKTLLHQLNEGLKKLKQNKEDEQKQMYQDKLLLLFRKTLSDLMKNWAVQESEETSNSIKELVKLIFWCAKKEIVLVKDALSFSEDFCDMLSVNDLREFIDTFESSIHTINYLSEQDSNYPLKICNVIFKKLTRTYDTRLRGELHIFLSKILPICHASGLKSKICTEITALLENESDVAKNQNIQGNQMEIEEEKSQADNNVTYSNKDFYKKFWTLQKYFQNPFCLSTNDEQLDIEKNNSASCSNNMEEEEVEEGEEKMIESKKVKAVCSAIQQVLDRFNQNPVFEKREPNIKPYIKYLTTFSLLEKQLSDPFFRKIWLLQALLFFYAIQNKTKDLEIKNIDSEMTLIKSTEEKVKKTFIQLHENLKEEINFEKLDLFFIDEKIWVERKDMLPRQNKDEKYNFKNPCEKTREMIDYYHKSILIDKKDSQQKSEFTFDSHKMLQQKQFAEMEAFKKKIIQDCCKTGGNSITEESNVRQILGKEFDFPISTTPIQKSVGYYINQVIDQLKDSTSEKLVDDPIFVTKAMRASFRYNSNWVEKDKETLKDLETFAKEFEEKDVDKLTKQEKEKERDKSSNKESQQQPEQVQTEDLKKSKIDKAEKSSRSNNENEENPQADQSRNTGSNFSSSRQEEKSKSQPQKIQSIKYIYNLCQAQLNFTNLLDQSEAKQVQEQQKSINSSNNQSSSNVEKTGQTNNSNSSSKNSNDNEQRGKHNDDRHKKDEKNDRQSHNSESSKSDSKIDEPKYSRQDNEKEKITSQENYRQQIDEKVNLRANDEQNNNERPRQSRQESNFSDSKNEETKSSSNKEEKSRNEEKSERSNQNSSSKQVVINTYLKKLFYLIIHQNQSDDKYKNKVDSKSKEERQLVDEENRRFQPSDDNRKSSKDESKRYYNQEDNRKSNNDENRKNNEEGRKNNEDGRKNNDDGRKSNDDQGFDKNDNQKQFQGNSNSIQSQSNQNSSKNSNQQQQNPSSSSSSSSKNTENQKNESKQGDESNKSQSLASNNNNNQGSGNFSNMNNSNNSKPQLILRKNDPQNTSQVNSGNSSGGRTQGRSRSKEKQSNSYSSGSGSSRSNTNNNNNNQYNSGINNNSNGSNNNYNPNNSYQQGGNNQYSNNNSYNSSKYNQRDDSKQNSGYGSQNNNYNQGNYNKGNNNNSSNYSSKREYNNNSQYDSNSNNNNNSNSNSKRDNNYDRKNFQNSNYYNNNRGNEYEPGPNKRQKN
ncbi:hypothetical protein ABPG74_021553 [Tetrahymena malaccensis]